MSVAEKVTTVLCALSAAAALVAPRAGWRALSMILALIATPALLAYHRWDTSTFSFARNHPPQAAAAALVGLVALCALAWLMYRHRPVFPLLAMAALPFRVPVTLSGTTSNLLIPLYVVIAAGALAWAVPVLAGRLDRVEEQPGSAAGRARVVAWLMAALIVAYALQSLYSVRFNKALGQEVFFYVPFALLLVLLVRVRWDARLLRQCLTVLVGIALLLCFVGFVELATRHLLLNPKLEAANTFGSAFRVNSLFYDPNVFGRFLALVAILVAGVLLWLRRWRDVAVASAVLGAIWLGLLSTLSQSSFVALVAGLLALAALRFDTRLIAAIAGGAAVLGLAFILAFGSAVHVDLSKSHALDSASSGRASLITGGADLFVQRPLQGWGSGAFTSQFRAREAARLEDQTQVSDSDRALAASHTIPITIAAEQGVVGLALYLALLVAGAVLLFAGASTSPARTAVAAAFVALVVHTLLYADFLEDPFTWALLGVGAALASSRATVAAADECSAQAAARPVAAAPATA